MFGYIIKLGQWYKKMYNVFIGIVIHREIKKKEKMKMPEYLCTIFSCEMKIMMAKEFDAKVKLQKVTIFLHINKKLSCLLHNYIFDYSDSIKLNSAVWLTMC